MDFILPPATFSPPKSVVKVVHSSSVGTCQPEGQIFFVEVPPAVIMPFAEDEDFSIDSDRSHKTRSSNKSDSDSSISFAIMKRPRDLIMSDSD